MHRELYRFGGMTFAIEAAGPVERSQMCAPFRVEDAAADHTICLTFSDAIPKPPQGAAQSGPIYRWQEGGARHLLQRYSLPGKTAQFTYAATSGAQTDVTFAESYRAGTSGICRNVTAPLRAVVLLGQAAENRVVRARPQEAFARLLSQCAYYAWDAASAARMTELAAQLVTDIPVLRLDCRADESAVRALEEAMRRA